MARNGMSAPFLLDPLNKTDFPNVNDALLEPDGLLAIGGDLSTERLLAAYRHGIFPWYSDGQPILWWSPNPRAVLFPVELKISRSLRKSIRRQNYIITADSAFDAVISECAVPRKDGLGTWITEEMNQAYIRLHQQGHAHSIEVWRDKRLIGGLYGVSVGQVFFGESMFSRESDASKLAFSFLVTQLKSWNYGLIDCQIYSEHLGTLGARVIPREDFVKLLEKYCVRNGKIGQWKFDISANDVLYNYE